jgi:SAM-dependent methyltransferase
MPLENVDRHYVGEAGRHYQEVKRGVPECAHKWIARLRSGKFSPYVSSDQVVLEFGVGNGWNLAELDCRRKIGFDVADGMEERVRSLGIEFIQDTTALAEGIVDVVICHHTLEHLLQPSDALHEMRRLLKLGGQLLLFVPFEKEARYEEFRSGEPNHHLYSWNAQTLGNLVSETGFKVIKAAIGEFGYSRFAAVWASRFKLGETGFRVLRRGLHMFRPAFEVRIVAQKLPA